MSVVAEAEPIETRTLVVRFAGDSGDGVQLAGGRFAHSAAASGADLMTLPEFPAEIRAPTGTTFGVSAYQVQFGGGEVLTPGDETDLLVAFNPAAFVTNIGFLKKGGTVLVDEGAFNDRAFAKAGLAADPLGDGTHPDYSVIAADMGKRALEAVAAFGLGHKDSTRAKNFWALGLVLWLAQHAPESTIGWVRARFSAEPALAGANAAALAAGYAYGETMELSIADAAVLEPAAEGRNVRMTSGTDAMALGIVAAGALAGRPIYYCSYPITPASALLHELAKVKAGVRTFQAEDEIAAASAAIGASYAGGLGVTASSGPGLSLKTEAIGLAVAAELPLIVIDVQRAGPSTGMPTKPEQSDLSMAIFGRHGEAPLPVFAPATPADCFAIMVEAARVAVESMTPVIVLSDAYLANAMSEWKAPDSASLVPFAGAAGGATNRGAFDRDPGTLARSWIAPGTEGGIHRVGGLEKDSSSGHISYDPANHEAMVRMRAEKIARIAQSSEGDLLQEGPDEGELAVIGWGSTFGPIRQATRQMRARGQSVTHLHLRRLWPLPRTLEASLRRFRHLACVEMNSGQLTAILRSTYLLPVVAVTQLSGRPFRIVDIERRLESQLLEGAAA